jgi:hypothetical protein
MGRVPVCFAGGARIRAARGDVAIDTIVPGDKVVVVRDGQESLEPVEWVGYSHIDIARHANPEDAAPIRFREGAIADGQPIRDLVVSPEHCLILDGLCVPAKRLVNGGSIVSEPDHPPFTYFHLELARHGILLAENTQAESYLDTGNRASFDNTDEPRLLHPTFGVNATSARWETDACAPLATLPEQVAPIWTRLAERSVAIGYPIPKVPTVSDADIHILADGQLFRPVSDRDGRCVFLLPAGVTSVSLISRSGIPADLMDAARRDTRRLGLRVNWIAVRTGSEDVLIPADHPALADGWNEIERGNGKIWRWTDGAATIPWKSVTQPVLVTIRCSPLERYPVRDRTARLTA